MGRQSPSAQGGGGGGNTEAVVESHVLIPPVCRWLFFCISDIICCINRLLNPPESAGSVKITED